MKHIKKIKIKHHGTVQGTYIIYTKNIWSEEALNLLEDVLQKAFRCDRRWLCLPSEYIKKVKFVREK